MKVGRSMEEGAIPRNRIYIDIGELSTKQRGAILGLIKDMGFETAEISEIVVVLEEERQDVKADRHTEKRK